MCIQMNVAKALEAVDGDRELLKSVVGDCLEQFPERLGEIESEIQQNNREQISRKVHSLRSNFGLLGADGAYKVATQLEMMAVNAKMGDVYKTFQKLMKEMKLIEKFYKDQNWTSI